MPLELSVVSVTAGYSPPDSNARLALDDAVNKHQNVSTKGALIVAGDFSHANLRNSTLNVQLEGKRGRVAVAQG